MEYEFQFEKLNAWKEAKALVKEVYSLVNKFPEREQFALSAQIRRAVISIPSNIAEQSGRTSLKDKARFLEIAFGSLMEVYCQLQIAVELSYITESQLDQLKPRIFLISRLISGLRNRFINKGVQ